MFKFFKHKREHLKSTSIEGFTVPPTELTTDKIWVEIEKQRKLGYHCANFPNSTISTRLRRELRQQGYIPHQSLDSENLPTVAIFW